MPRMITFRWILRSLRVAGWAPLGVFLLHVALSQGWRAYARLPPLDIPVHLLGGAAIAFFIASCLGVAAELGLVGSPSRLLVDLMVMSSTCAAAIAWEMAEWVSDRFAGTHAQLGLDDTLLDMLLGILGGTSFLVGSSIAARRRQALGLPAAVTTSEAPEAETRRAERAPGATRQAVVSFLAIMAAPLTAALWGSGYLLFEPLTAIGGVLLAALVAPPRNAPFRERVGVLLRPNPARLQAFRTAAGVGMTMIATVAYMAVAGRLFGVGMDSGFRFVAPVLFILGCVLSCALAASPESFGHARDAANRLVTGMSVAPGERPSSERLQAVFSVLAVVAALSTTPLWIVRGTPDQTAVVGFVPLIAMAGALLAAALAQPRGTSLPRRIGASLDGGPASVQAARTAAAIGAITLLSIVFFVGAGLFSGGWLAITFLFAAPFIWILGCALACVLAARRDRSARQFWTSFRWLLLVLLVLMVAGTFWPAFMD